MTELNELFEQIFHAELKFKARTDKLKQRECQKSDYHCTCMVQTHPQNSITTHAVAESIEQGKLEILRTREEHATKQGELAVKSNKVAELEVELKLLSIRKEVLQEQKDSLVQKKQELTENLVS